jgi:hypothetical protein
LVGFSGLELNRWLITQTKKSKTTRKEDAMAQTIATPQGSNQTVDKNAIRPFPKVNFPEAELTELRRRITATRWPERETVTDASQGVQLATTQALAHYWATEYDWRKCEARLNTFPQFKHDKGGHFAAFEQPQLLAEDLRAGFRSLRKYLQDVAA